jgi:predicted dehydrogenase
MNSDSAVMPLRAVVVGLGVMGSHHARMLASLAAVELVAAVDHDDARQALAGRRYPGLAVYGTLEEAIQAQQLDIAAVAVPVEYLAPVARVALEGGLHVLVEKPTAATEQEALALADYAQAHALTLGVGHIERFNPAVIALHSKLEQGLIGSVLQMRARRLSPFPNRDAMRGAAMDLASHDIDVMRYLSGQEIARVYAETAHSLGQEYEDMICATLRFDGDVVGLLDVNWLTPTKVRQLAVTGERGMLTVDYLTQELCFFEHPTRANYWDALASIRGGGEGPMTRFAFDRREPLRVEWEAFLAAVREARPAPVTARDGAAALSTARAIRESGKRHEPVIPAYRAMFGG